MSIIYSVTDSVVQDFSIPFLEVSDFAFALIGKKYDLKKGIDTV